MTQLAEITATQMIDGELCINIGEGPNLRTLSFYPEENAQEALSIIKTGATVDQLVALSERQRREFFGAPTQPGKGKFIYVISCVGLEAPTCKIGIAIKPEKRLKQLATYCPHPVTLEMAVYSEDARDVEAAAHRHFEPYRSSGEWFSIPSVTAIEFINSEMEERRAA